MTPEDSLPSLPPVPILSQIKPVYALPLYFINISINFFDVLLTVHLSIILVINQLNAQNLVL